MNIQLHTLCHHFDLTMKKTSQEWIQENNGFVKTGGVLDCYFKAQIKTDASGKLALRVFGLESGNVVNIELKTKSEKKAMAMADSYLESINAINGNEDEFELY
jgi:hypothetical protein